MCLIEYKHFSLGTSLLFFCYCIVLFHFSFLCGPYVTKCARPLHIARYHIYTKEVLQLGIKMATVKKFNKKQQNQMNEQKCMDTRV